MPKVSVILTSYNHEKYIAAAIDSVLSQTYSDFELFILDDCSMDSSWDIIQSYKDPRIIPIRSEINTAGRIFWHNVHRYSGKYIAIHHSDDGWMPAKLEKQVAFLDNHQEYDACFTWVQFIDESGDNVKSVAGMSTYPEGLFDQENRNRHEWLRTFFYQHNKLCHPSVLIRKNAHIDYGLRSDGFTSIPDFAKWIRLCRHADIYVIPEKLTKFRLRENNENTSGEKPSNIIQASIEIFFLLKEFLKIEGEEFCKVFPEASKYQTSKGMIVEYAFARLCLDNKNSAYKLFGLETLFNLLNDPDKALQLENVYGFTRKDFSSFKTQHDVFRCISPHRYLKTSLYLDSGNGFSYEDRIMQAGFLAQDSFFTAKYNLAERGGIKALRFSPHEGYFCSCRIHKVLIDGCEYTAVPIGSAKMRDGSDLFSTLNPVYHINGAGQNVTIYGTLKVLSNEEISTLLLKQPQWSNITDDGRLKILYGAGAYGERALEYYGTDLVYAFADMNKHGTEYLGKPVIEPLALTDLEEEYEIIICVDDYQSVCAYLKNIGVNNFRLFFQVDKMHIQAPDCCV